MMNIPTILLLLSYIFSSYVKANYPRCKVRSFRPVTLFKRHLPIEQEVQFFTYGDSHSVCATTSLLQESGRVRWHNNYLLARLMHSFVRDGLSLLDVKKLSSPPPNSILLFSFGAVDLSHHVHRHQEMGKSNVIEKLIDGYENIIVENLSQLPPSVNTWIMGILPSHDRDPRIRSNTIRMNSLLKEVCQRKSWFFLDLYEDYKDEDGFLRFDLSDQMNHIGQHLLKTQKKVAIEIEKVRKNLLLL